MMRLYCRERFSTPTVISARYPGAEYQLPIHYIKDRYARHAMPAAIARIVCFGARHHACTCPNNQSKNQKQNGQQFFHFGPLKWCVDVKNVLVRKIDLRDLEEINMLRDCTNFEEFVIINTVVQADEDSSGEFDNERQRKHINKLLQRNETFIK